jgi:hypothetical protein
MDYATQLWVMKAINASPVLAIFQPSIIQIYVARTTPPTTGAATVSVTRHYAAKVINVGLVTGQLSMTRAYVARTTPPITGAQMVYVIRLLREAARNVTNAGQE